MKEKVVYRGYHLIAMSSTNDDGKFQARVAATVLSGPRTRSQRFLDFGIFDSEQEADRFALEEAQAWVDDELGTGIGPPPTNFGAF